jgi:hypothetical protein
MAKKQNKSIRNTKPQGNKIVKFIEKSVHLEKNSRDAYRFIRLIILSLNF